MSVQQQVVLSVTGIEFLNLNSEEENGYNKLMTVSSSGWQIMYSSPFCLSTSDALNIQRSVTIHSTEAAVQNSLLTPNHSPNPHTTQVPETYALSLYSVLFTPHKMSVRYEMYQNVTKCNTV